MIGTILAAVRKRIRRGLCLPDAYEREVPSIRCVRNEAKIATNEAVVM